MAPIFGYYLTSTASLSDNRQQEGARDLKLGKPRDNIMENISAKAEAHGANNFQCRQVP